MKVIYKELDGDESNHAVLLSCLSSFVHSDSHRRFVLQNRMVLFGLLNSYITKRQFLILCHKFDIYGGGGSEKGDRAIQSYARRFFSEKCRQGIFRKRERKILTGSRKDTVYTVTPKGLDKLKETIPLCGIDFPFEMSIILTALSCLKKKQWHEPAHYSHMLGIGDFFACVAACDGCTMFLKEMSIENGFTELPGRASKLVCNTITAPFRADAYVRLGHGLMEEKTTGGIEILYEQDTGTQRKDILLSKLQNYNGLFQYSGNNHGEGLICLLFSCLNDSYAEKNPSMAELSCGKREAEFVSGLKMLGMDEMPENTVLEAEEGVLNQCPEAIFSEEENLCSVLMMQMGISQAALRKLYLEIRGVSCLMERDDVYILLDTMEKVLSLEHMGEHLGKVKVQSWKDFLSLLRKYGKSNKISAYDRFFSSKAEGHKLLEDKMSGERYALYHQHMTKFLKRRKDIEESMLKQDAVCRAALWGNMVSAVPGYHMQSLLSFLFPGNFSFRKQLRDYLNMMYFGISSFTSYCLLKEDRQGVLRNYFEADTLCGQKGFNVENLSLDLTSRMRLAYYLKDYAAHPLGYGCDRVLLIFFLSDDLPRVREFASDMELYRPYEDGYLKERISPAHEKSVFEALFICIEDMQDKSRHLPAVVFDRFGNAHYKMFSCKGRPKLLDIPMDSRRMDTPANIFE